MRKQLVLKSLKHREVDKTLWQNVLLAAKLLELKPNNKGAEATLVLTYMDYQAAGGKNIHRTAIKLINSRLKDLRC